jgi:hypothetical protein
MEGSKKNEEEKFLGLSIRRMTFRELFILYFQLIRLSRNVQMKGFY